MRDQRSRKGRYELLIYRGSAGGSGALSGALATGGGPVHVDAAQRMLVRFVGTLASSARGRYDDRRLEFYERSALGLGSAARADPQAHGHQPTKVLAQTPPTTGYDPVVACLTARAISGPQAKWCHRGSSGKHAVLKELINFDMDEQTPLTTIFSEDGWHPYWLPDDVEVEAAVGRAPSTPGAEETEVPRPGTPPRRKRGGSPRAGTEGGSRTRPRHGT
mmetsp:Transcript_21443/g.69231  ORF Transcript_21443/g.69231 Transcript_21443/m.69231 type:complete len:219 (+) Transcript_21443:856-1512(+)